MRMTSMDITKIIRSNRKTIALEINEQGELIVRAPQRISRKQLEEIVKKHDNWIEKKRKEVQGRPKPIRHRLEEGEPVLYLGTWYSLNLEEKESGVHLQGTCLMVPKTSPEQKKEKIERWYREQAREILIPRIYQYAQKYGFQVQGAKITSARTRWGSCSGKNTICLSWYLIMAPLPVIDSVIIHELCHTVYHDHSGLFWALVGQKMPDYQRHRQWLKDHRQWLCFDCE